MSVIEIEDFEITPGHKLNMQSKILRAGIKRCQNKNLLHNEGNNKVIDPFELILEMHEIMKANDKRYGNVNGRKK
jgi:hypothetical protein